MRRRQISYCENSPESVHHSTMITEESPREEKKEKKGFIKDGGLFVLSKQ